MEVKFRKPEFRLVNPSKAWAQISAYLDVSIKTRTEQGLDADGNSFARYSSTYLNYRRKHGGSEIVNLTSVGYPSAHMMQSMKLLRRTEKDMEFGLTGEAAVKGFKVENTKKRIFLAMNEKDQKNILDILVKNIEL